MNFVFIYIGEVRDVSSISKAIHICNAKRIGHGCALFQDESLMEYINDNRITLECCPTSNLQTGLD